MRVVRWRNARIIPGTDYARRLGCPCSLMPNAFGPGYEHYLVVFACPVHGSTENEEIASVDEAENERTSSTVAVTGDAESWEVVQ